MEVINDTNYSNLLYRAVLSDEKFAASAMIRVLYDINNEDVVPSKNQNWQWELSEGPWMSEFGPVESDLVYKRHGVDLLVFGKAIAPKKKPVKEMEVSVNLGNKFKNKLKVFGNRFWEKGALGFVITEPELFTNMPLSLNNAFGGSASWDGLQIPYGVNATGKGYCYEKEEVHGLALPNIEDPNNLITNWKDKPFPVGFCQCPMSGYKMIDNIEHENGKMKSFSAKIFNTAFPQMILDEINIGDKIEIVGMTVSSPFFFIIPDHQLYFELKLGAKVFRNDFKISQIGIFPGHRKAFITYNFPFQYLFKPMEKRSISFREKIQN